MTCARCGEQSLGSVHDDRGGGTLDAEHEPGLAVRCALLERGRGEHVGGQNLPVGGEAVRGGDCAAVRG